VEKLIGEQLFTILTVMGPVGAALIVLLVYIGYTKFKRMGEMAKKLVELESRHTKCSSDTAQAIAVFNLEVVHVKETMNRVENKLDTLIKNGKRNGSG